jgi:hypothetical protein
VAGAAARGAGRLAQAPLDAFLGAEASVDVRRTDREARYAVLTATPDLVQQHLLPRLLQMLLDHQIDVVAAIPRVFTAADAVMLYDGHITHKSEEPRTHSGWLAPRLFAAGPSLMLVLRSRTAGEALVARVAALKGRSRIGQYRSDQMRGLSRITDRSLSLVHSPDDFAGVLHELGLFAGTRGIAAVFEEQRGALAKAVLEAILPSTTLASEPNPFDILPRVMAQAAAMCACAALNSPHEALSLLHELQACRRELGRFPIDSALELALWRLLAPLQGHVDALFKAERDKLDWNWPAQDLRHALKRLELLSVLRRSCSPRDFDLQESNALADALRACHLPPAPWDEHRLDLIAAYHRRR